MSWKPRPENAEWLSWALERAEEAPYEVTTRWLFYRCVQELGFTKDDYPRFKQFTSKARKSYWNGWAPDTLTDDTRNPIGEYGSGFTSVESWLESQQHKRPLLEFEKFQDNIVFICFEAKAMISQFKHYLEDYRIPMWPFGGDASIPFKYRLAQEIDDINTKYPDKPIYILYFGDYDPKGLEIPDNAIRDIYSWCGCEFELNRIGINFDHIDRFSIPDNPDAPGKYQWEALDENGAETLINQVFDYFDKGAFEEVVGMERRAADIWSNAVGDAIDRAKEEL